LTARVAPARVVDHRETTPGFRWLTLELPPDFPEMLPGQYLDLRTSPGHDPLLRRPFGVVAFRRGSGAAVATIYYAVVGPGTRNMAAWRHGDRVDCLGPLGRPYEPDLRRPALLVAGGRGAAPLFFLHDLLRDRGHEEVRFAFGARSAPLLFGLDRVEEARLLVATDDGSAGHRGTVVDALEKRPAWWSDDPVLYVCGPERLLAAAAAFAASRGLPCQVSLEGVYACGLGLCRGCAVPLRGETRYLMQCVEGPVVDAARIDWERMPHA
jgi:dihydroorotate dehydrogenase electron transfer subunit